MHRNRRAKIVATVGPASASPEMLKSLFETGVDTFRPNFSHGSHEDHAAVFRSIRALEKEAGRPIGILQTQDNIVVAGIPFGRPGTTSNLRVVQLKEEVDRRGP